MTLKFLADMPISPKTVAFLCESGYEAVRIFDIGMKDAEDYEIVDYANKNDYIILTMDLDFGAIIALRNLSKPSVITCRLENLEVFQIKDLLDKRLDGIKEYLLKCSIIIFEEFRVRIRELPINVNNF